MTEQLLNVNGLKVNVEDREILHGIDLQMNAGETHVLMGPNGAGKSTLGYALMGNPKFEITEGSIFFKNKDITEEAVEKRASWMKRIPGWMWMRSARYPGAWRNTRRMKRARFSSSHTARGFWKP